jgi:hypothetical protein
MFAIVRVIPCPRMAAFVSNAALIGAFVALTLVAYILYGNIWQTYTYIMMIWPWLAIGTIVARLHIGRQRDSSNLSPLFHFPILGCLGAGSMVGVMISLKDLSITDCIVFSFLDPIWSAIFHLLTVKRIPYFERYTRFFVAAITLVFFYIYGQAYSGAITRAYLDSVNFMTFPGTISAGTYLLYMGSRASHLLKCSYIKYAFIPKEVGQSLQFKSLFPSFPAPIRFRLDAIFDSGLVEDIPHAVGPTGTSDLYTLTDNLYMLPLASLGSWIIENSYNNTLKDGLTASGDVAGSPGYGFVYFILVTFCLSLLLAPMSSSKLLFDRGSSPHSWAIPPILMQMIFVGIDFLFLNPYISRFQIICLFALLWFGISFREQLWSSFKRRYYVNSLAELEFLQPSCIRTTQRETLHDALDKSGVEDFGTLLLETAIHHGNNIKDHLRQREGAMIWDPNPAARAAWKLAGSLVIRTIRSRKHASKEIDKSKEKTRDIMSTIIAGMVHSAASYKHPQAFTK